MKLAYSKEKRYVLKKSKNTWSRYRTSKQVKKACTRKNPKILDPGIRLQNKCKYHAQEKIPKILDPDIRLQNKWKDHTLEKIQKYLFQT